METSKDFFTWINANAQIISITVTILVALIPAVFSFTKYINLKNKELAHERFKIYHELIRNLVQPDSPGQPMSIDRQIAVVYELRNFSEYFELTERMLNGLLESWSDPRFNRLTNEINSTLKFINKNS